MENFAVIRYRLESIHYWLNIARINGGTVLVTQVGWYIRKQILHKSSKSLRYFTLVLSKCRGRGKGLCHFTLSKSTSLHLALSCQSRRLNCSYMYVFGQEGGWGRGDKRYLGAYLPPHSSVHARSHTGRRRGLLQMPALVVEHLNDLLRAKKEKKKTPFKRAPGLASKVRIFLVLGSAAHEAQHSGYLCRKFCQVDATNRRAP